MNLDLNHIKSNVKGLVVEETDSKVILKLNKNNIKREIIIDYEANTVTTRKSFIGKINGDNEFREFSIETAGIIYKDPIVFKYDLIQELNKGLNIFDFIELKDGL